MGTMPLHTERKASGGSLPSPHEPANPGERRIASGTRTHRRESAVPVHTPNCIEHRIVMGRDRGIRTMIEEDAHQLEIIGIDISLLRKRNGCGLLEAPLQSRTGTCRSHSSADIFLTPIEVGLDHSPNPTCDASGASHARSLDCDPYMTSPPCPSRTRLPVSHANCTSDIRVGEAKLFGYVETQEPLPSSIRFLAAGTQFESPRDTRREPQWPPLERRHILTKIIEGSPGTPDR